MKIRVGWIEAIEGKTGNVEVFENFGICSLHFLAEDYAQYSVTLPTYQHKKGPLKPNAIPSKNLTEPRMKSIILILSL